MEKFNYKITVFLALIAGFLSYSFALYFTETEEPIAASESASKGKMVWQEKNCTACHQLYGLGGHLGPDLTNVYDRKPETYIKFVLQNGYQAMPNFNLSEKEINELVEFLKYTNTTGKADPTTFTTHLDGTISK
ncbi:MAG: cytochrome c [Flavobacteriaceae bacterium]|jgi:nitric oxide reductase subunit C|nr:cytochrome c [Flavobacteriaceae bacterium]